MVEHTLLDFNNWLIYKAKGHDLMKNNAAIETKTEDAINTVTK